MSSSRKPARLTERSLVDGRSGGPGVRIRQAGPGDLGAARELVQLVGVELDDGTAAAVTDGSAGAALRAGLRDGREGFTRYMAEQFHAHPPGSWSFT